MTASNNKQSQTLWAYPLYRKNGILVRTIAFTPSIFVLLAIDNDSTESVSHAWRTALFAFALSRALLLCIWVLASSFHVTVDQNGTFAPRVILSTSPVYDTLHQLALYNDAGWYASIVQHGYEQRIFDTTHQANWAFFPLHPMLWWAISLIFGEITWSGLFISNVCFLGALFSVYHVVTMFGFGHDVARRAVVAMALFPVSYFFSLPWTESLFVLLSTSSYVAALRNRWWLAGSLGALASATRLSGLFLLPALGVLMLERHGYRPKKAWLALALIPLGITAFATYLWYATGNPFAFSEIQVAWGRYPQLPLTALLSVADHPFTGAEEWNFIYLNFVMGLLAVACSIWLVVQRHYSLAVFVLLGILAPLATGTLMSLTRYAMGLFPIYIVIGAITWRRSWEISWLTASAGTFAIMAALFACRINIAGA